MDDAGRRWQMPWDLWLRAMAKGRGRLSRTEGHPGKQESLRSEEFTSLRSPSSELFSGPPTEPAEAQLAERLNRALGELEEADRAVLRMRVMESRGYEEIGRLLGIGAAAARRRFGQALIRLQQVLSEHGLLE
jgi:RNA polymerase sigma factor (sigma-70 family)